MKIFSRFPVFRVVIPFSTGILLTIKTELPITTSAALAIGGFVIATVFTFKNYASGKYAQRWLAGIPFYCCFLGLGGSLTWVHQSQHHASHFTAVGGSGPYLVELKDEPARTSSGFRFTAKVTAVKNLNTWTPSRGVILVYIKDSSHTMAGEPGTKMLLKGQVKRITASTNPDAFNPAVFYAGKGAWHQVYVGEGDYQLLDIPISKTVFTYARMLRDEMLEKLQLHLGNRDLGVAGALLLGYEEWLDSELENYWRGAGVLHVLCVSGMHVMLIYVILAGMLGWMEKNKFLRHFRYLLLLVLIWFYAMVTGFSPSVIRAAAMISFVIAGNWLNREASIYNLLCSSCMLMFTLDPYLIISAGFQLSFLAVCGIIFLHKLMLPLWNAPNRLLHKIWELISVSLAAQLSTFPLSLFLFHQFPNYFLVGNLLIIPLSTAVMYSGLLLLVTDWIPYAGLVTGTVTSLGIRALNWLVVAIGNLPGALTEDIYLSISETLLLYLLLIFIPVWLVYKSPSWLLICLVLILLIFSSRIYLLHKANSNNRITVYDSRGKSVISVLNGRHAVVITDDSTSTKNLRYSAGEHLIANLVDHTRFIEINGGTILQIVSSRKGPIYMVKDWKKGADIQGYLASKTTGVLILGGQLSVEAEQIVRLRPAMVVFDSSCRKYQVQKLKNDLSKYDIMIHDVAREGAFTWTVQNVSGLFTKN